MLIVFLFFDNEHALKFIEKKIITEGIDKVTNKIDWMYERISSEKAKAIAKPLYLQAKEKLKNY